VIKREIMKTIFRHSFLLFALVALFYFQACTPEKEDPFADNVYLLSAERKSTMTISNVQTLLTTAATMYPSISVIMDDVKSGVIVYAVTYNTTFKGEDVIASGLIAIPDKEGDYPILSFQNGTNTLYAEAPSVNPLNTLYMMLECVSSTGYIVVIPDYLGFGSSEDIFHPYLHKESTVTTIIDMLHACGEFDEDIAKNITFLDEYYLLGYSQGGWATLALLETLDQDYSSEFHVAGCGCGAGPYDIEYFNSYVLGLAEYPMPSFLGYIAKAYYDNGLFTNPLTDLFKEQYATNINTYFDGKHSTGQINDQLTTTIADLFTADYLSGFASSAKYLSIRTALAANSIEAWNTSVPLLFTHGTDDVYVPPVISQNMYNAMINAGTSSSTCSYTTLSGLDHTEGIVPACFASLTFFKTLKK
jgi:pimeloyl-ACP methyl ester carboxylesterase